MLGNTAVTTKDGHTWRESQDISHWLETKNIKSLNSSDIIYKRISKFSGFLLLVLSNKKENKDIYRNFHHSSWVGSTEVFEYLMDGDNGVKQWSQ